MKKTSFVALIITILAVFTSCGGDGNLPEGMQLVRGGEDIGYYFYAPEEWTVANNGDISAAYASKIDISSVTFAPSAAPMSDITSYFENALAEFTFELTNTPTIEACDFGNADSAFKTVYDYNYEEHPFRSMQIFVTYGERFYIFTFTAQLANRSEDQTYYDFYLEKVQSVIDNFEFTAISGTDAVPEYEADGDGYLLVSDKNICGYDFYVNPDWKVRYAETNIGISTTDGANANITEATSVGVAPQTYWENRQAELSAFVENLTVIKENAETTLGNAEWALAYEYTYEYNGSVYHIYQIIAVAGTWPLQDGYVFTYTAPENLYDAHLEEFNEMVKKVNFR